MTYQLIFSLLFQIFQKYFVVILDLADPTLPPKPKPEIWLNKTFHVISIIE